MKPEEARREIKRLEDRRLRIAPEVMGGDREVFEEDKRLERRIRELASAEREGRADEIREGLAQEAPRGRGVRASIILSKGPHASLWPAASGRGDAPRMPCVRGRGGA